MSNEAIEFAKWLKHLDNGDEHYNPYTNEKSASIGFSPFDCFIDNFKTVEELYEHFKNTTPNNERTQHNGAAVV